MAVLSLPLSQLGRSRYSGHFNGVLNRDISLYIEGGNKGGGGGGGGDE